MRRDLCCVTHHSTDHPRSCSHAPCKPAHVLAAPAGHQPRVVRRRCRRADPRAPRRTRRGDPARQAQADLRPAHGHRRPRRDRERRQGAADRQQARAEAVLPPLRVPRGAQDRSLHGAAVRAPLPRGREGGQGHAAPQPARPADDQEAEGLRRPDPPARRPAPQDPGRRPGLGRQAAIEQSNRRTRVTVPAELARGTGRRKEAVARVRLIEGTGTFKLNGRPLEDYFPNPTHRRIITEPLRVTNTLERYDVVASLDGGGVSGQAGALRHGITRALVELDVELPPELALAVGRAAVPVLSQGRQAAPLVVVGRDPRASGVLLESALVAGIMSAGGQALVTGVLPTPAIAYLTRHYGAAAGAMISASHNPMPDNGIKFFGPEGFKLPDALEERIEAALSLADQGGPRPVGPAVGGLRQAGDAAAEVVPEAYRRAGASVTTIGASPDGHNINDGCGCTHPDHVGEAVVRAGAACGLAHDGD